MTEHQPRACTCCSLSNAYCGACRQIWPCDAQTAQQRIRTLEAAFARATAALEDFAQFGIRADCNPTMPGTGRDTGWWYEYLGSADRYVKARAKRAADDARTALAEGTP